MNELMNKLMNYCRFSHQNPVLCHRDREKPRRLQQRRAQRRREGEKADEKAELTHIASQ